MIIFLQDSIPELAEVFSIKILSAHLISNPSTVVPLGNLTESIVTILPSDNPQGLFNFPLDRSVMHSHTHSILDSLLGFVGSISQKILEHSMCLFCVTQAPLVLLAYST